jgi:hypothetical protein
VILQCTADDSGLLVLNLRGNHLSGNATIVESCGNLVSLDVSHNDFTGPLPASEHWDELASYRTRHNRLSGTFPPKLATSARILEVCNRPNVALIRCSSSTAAVAKTWLWLGEPEL